MIFLRPDYLLYMIIPMIILFYFIITGKNQIDTIFDEKILEKLTVDNDTLGRTGRNLMLFVSLFLFIIALARPALPKGDITVATKKIDLALALDISKSMLATDRYPNRLEFAKQKIYKLLDDFPQARAAVIAFGDDGFLVSPLSEDRQTLKYLIKNLSLESISTNGTNLLVPIIKSAQLFKNKQDKILIIFTDGGDKKEFSKEIKKAQENGVNVYIYAIGTIQGSPITYLGEKLKDTKGNIVISKLNEHIKELAIQTGGGYIEGDYKDTSIAMIVKDIKEKYKMQQYNNKNIKDVKELFYYPLALSILFMLFAFSSLPKRSFNLLLVGIFVFHDIPLDAGVFDFQQIKQANKAYKNKAFSDAIEHFSKIVYSKRDASSYYDLGNAQYKAHQYKQAIQSYKNANTAKQDLKYKIYFNLGNAYYQSKMYKKALNAYEIAKKIKSEPDLLYNIELTKKHLNKKPPSNQKKDKQNKNNQDKKQEQNKSSKNKQKDDGNKKDPKKNKNRQTKQQNSQKPKHISKQEIKKWEQKLEKSKPKTMPMRFKIKDIQREKNAKPW